MQPPGIAVFGETIDKTGQWLTELALNMDCSSQPQRAYSILRAVLHVLRDRLTVDEAANLGAQLPMLVRGFYFEGWRPSARPVKFRHKEEFFEQLDRLYPGLTASDREQAVQAVFRLLSRHVTGGEIQQVRNQLPAELRSLWDAAE
jgi:uncharacterized protein (DUF2267 family)